MNRRRLMKSGGIDPVTGRGFVNGYEVVDLGLSNGLLFATCNVGASVETDYGDYYMYGKGSQKYNSSDSMYFGTENPLASSADTATQVMGSKWRMPTSGELYDLLQKTDRSLATINGIQCYKFTSKINPTAYMFFPVAGEYDGSDFIEGEGEYGAVWSSTPYDNYNASILGFSLSQVNIDVAGRKFGASVRGVTSSPNIPLYPVRFTANLFVEIYPETDDVTSFVPNTDFEVICVYNNTFKTLYEFKAGTSYPITNKDGNYYILLSPDEKVVEIDREDYTSSTTVTFAVVFPNGYDGQEVIGTFNDGTEYITQGGSSLYTCEINGQNFICSYDITSYNREDVSMMV